MNHDFRPKTLDGMLSHIIEECGEVLHAAGKTQRHGYDSVNPLIPESERETNAVWLMREITDLKQAISRFEEQYAKEFL